MILLFRIVSCLCWVDNLKANPGFIWRTVATMLRKASHCIASIISTWNWNEARTITFPIDHLEWIHLQSYYVNGMVIEWRFPAVFGFMAFPACSVKATFGMFFVKQYVLYFHSKKKSMAWWVKERKTRSGRPLSVCCLYTKQRVLEACARSILLAKRSDSSVPSQHI